MRIGFGLFLQRLTNAKIKVIILGHFESFRHKDGWFSPPDILKLFDSLKVPAPSNIHRVLGQLKKDGLILHHRTLSSWGLTPKGRQKAIEVIKGINLKEIQAELSILPGAEFGFVRHSVIPPEFAPPRLLPGITRLLESYDFDKNVFCMTRFPDSSTDKNFLDPVKEVIKIAKRVLNDHGLYLHLASEHQLDDELFANIGAHMWACRYGLGLLENRAGRGLNNNTVIEIGGMLIAGRRCGLLKDNTLSDLPTDLAGHIYKSVDFSDLDAIQRTLHMWVAKDLVLGSCKNCGN